MLLPKGNVNKYKELSEMPVHDYIPVINVPETLKCTICLPLHLLENLFFSPVLHCTPHDLPQVIVRFIIYEFDPKNFLKMRCKECRQHCQCLLYREFEYAAHVSHEFRVWILQWVAIDTEGTGRYDVRGESGHRLLHFHCGTWKLSVVVLLPRLPRWCLHLNVVGEFENFRDPESFAGVSVATGRDTQAGQVKG